jgi:hypothetical protein
MRIPPFRPLAVVLLSLALVTLACARANLPIVPVTPDYATRQPPTATSTSLPPTATVPLPTDTAAPPTDTPAAPPTAADTLAAPTLTPAAASAAASPTSPARATTQAPAATSVPATAVPPTPTPTHSAPTQTPLPTPTAVPPTIPPQTGQTVSIPANATFTQKFSATNQGGEMIGDPGYLIDGKTVTWAALDGGHAAWVLDLGSAQNLAGVRVYAQKPRSGDPTTLLAVEVSNDGQSWQAVFTGTGDCGEPNCDILPQMKFVDIGFSPVSARYLRLRGGPTRFGFAEILLAVMP